MHAPIRLPSILKAEKITPRDYSCATNIGLHLFGSDLKEISLMWRYSGILEIAKRKQEKITFLLIHSLRCPIDTPEDSPETQVIDGVACGLVLRL